jgi:hypothetical protein
MRWPFWVAVVFQLCLIGGNADEIHAIDRIPDFLGGTSKNIHLQKLSGHEKAAVGRPCNSIPYDDYSNTSLGS